MLNGLNLLDYVMILTLGFSTLFGLLSGFLGSSLGLARTLLAAYLASFLTVYTTPILSPYITNPILAQAASLCVPFMCLMLLLNIGKRVLLEKCKGVHKKFIDRSLGILFGFFKGYVLFAMVFAGLAMSNNSLTMVKDHAGKWALQYDEAHFPPLISDASALPLMKMGSSFFFYMLPNSMVGELYPMLELMRLKNQLDGHPDSTAGTSPETSTDKDANLLKLLQALPGTSTPSSQTGSGTAKSAPTDPATSPNPGTTAAPDPARLQQMIGDILKLSAEQMRKPIENQPAFPNTPGVSPPPTQP